MSVANNLEKRAANKSDIELSKNKLMEKISDTYDALHYDIDKIKTELKITEGELKEAINALESKAHATKNTLELEITESKNALKLELTASHNALYREIESLRADVKLNVTEIEAVLYKTLHKHFMITIGAVLACNTFVLTIFNYANWLLTK